MVRIDNIFEASLSHTQALPADSRINISYFPMVNSQSIRYQWYGSTTFLRPPLATHTLYQQIHGSTYHIFRSWIRSPSVTNGIRIDVQSLPSVAKVSRNERSVCMRQYWTTIDDLETPNFQKSPPPHGGASWESPPPNFYKLPTPLCKISYSAYSHQDLLHSFYILLL